MLYKLWNITGTAYLFDIRKNSTKISKNKAPPSAFQSAVCLESAVGPRHKLSEGSNMPAITILLGPNMRAILIRMGIIYPGMQAMLINKGTKYACNN